MLPSSGAPAPHGIEQGQWSIARCLKEGLEVTQIVSCFSSSSPRAGATGYLFLHLITL